jgi:hypothetical protein
MYSGATWALTSVWIVSRKLYPRSPSQFFFWSIIVLTIFIVYRAVAFLRRSIGIRVILRQQLGKDEYEVSLRKAKELSGYYVLSMMGIGLFLDMLLFWVSSWDTYALQGFNQSDLPLGSARGIIRHSNRLIA